MRRSPLVGRERELGRLATALERAADGDARLMLYSARLEREVIPRLTSAHNYVWKSLPIYRFLCALQSQGAAWLGWDWGVLQRAPYLPRLTTGKLVLVP